MRNLILVVMSTAIAFIAVEVLMGRFFPVSYMSPPEPMSADAWRELIHRASSVPGLNYELVPGMEKYSHGVNIKINSHGMRDDEPLDGQAQLLCNILVLGDSYTFGFGVESEETYTNVLEDLLSNHTTDQAVQALNMGVGGYSSRDESLVVKNKGMMWDPDLIVLGYVLNDPETDPIQPLHRYYQDESWWQYSNILRLVASVKNENDVKVLGGGNYIRYLHNPDGEKWNSVLTAFSDIHETAMEADIPVLLVIFPLMRGGDWDDYQYSDLHTQVAAAGMQAGFHTVDLTDVFSVHLQRLLMVAADDAHPNNLGHRIAAEAIFKAIQAYNLLDCS